MPTWLPELLTWLALWLVPSGLILAWMWADEWLACPAESLSECHDRLDHGARDLSANEPAFERLGKEANR